MPRDFTTARQVAVGVSVFCKAPCRTFFRMRADKLQRLIRFPPASITRQLARNMHFFMMADGPNISALVTPKRWKDSQFALNWKALFPQFVSRVNFPKTKQSS